MFIIFMNIKTLLLALFCATIPWLSLSAKNSEIPEAIRLSHYNISKDALALKGYDPVSYFLGEPKKGNNKLVQTHRGITYHFSNQENLDAFKSAPTKYEPQYGGWCAWAMYDDGSRAGIDPKSYLIIDGKLYVFYDTIIADTRKLWIERSQSVEQRKMLDTAADYWRKQINE